MLLGERKKACLVNPPQPCLHASVLSHPFVSIPVGFSQAHPVLPSFLPSFLPVVILHSPNSSHPVLRKFTAIAINVPSSVPGSLSPMEHVWNVAARLIPIIVGLPMTNLQIWQTVWCYRVDTQQNLWGMFAILCWTRGDCSYLED